MEPMRSSPVGGVHSGQGQTRDGGDWTGGPKIGSESGTRALQKRADDFAAAVGPVAAEMREKGLSLRQIAGELAFRGIMTPRGGAWTAAAVRNVLGRTAT